MTPFSSELAFKVRNLGSIREGGFVHKPLTLFCGPNNTGKTWALYSLYYFYWRLRGLERGKQIPKLGTFNKRLSETLPDFFNSASMRIETAEFHLEDGADWKRITRGAANVSIFLMPAERNGLHLFFRELGTRRTALLHHASREKIDIRELLRDVIRSRYAMPIAHYIDWLNDLPEIQRRKSSDFHSHAERLKKDLAGGAYKVDARSGSIEFKPYQYKRDGIPTSPLDLHVTSSTVKSLFGLWFYLEHQAQKGGLLMIDEPELNLHPDNQRKIARLLARLVNAGLNVTISTHSDYIVREFNSLIMLNQDKDKKLQKKHAYQEDEILQPDNVGAYRFKEQAIKPFQVTPEDGIYATTFDDAINDLNNKNDDIYYSLQEQKERRDERSDD